MIELSKRLGFAAESGRAGNADITMVKQLGTL